MRRCNTNIRCCAADTNRAREQTEMRNFETDYPDDNLDVSLPAAARVSNPLALPSCQTPLCIAAWSGQQEIVVSQSHGERACG